MFAKTPPPPYFAVIFSSIKSEDDTGYAEMANKMMDLVSKEEGFLGVETAREQLGITVSYWKDLESIKKWKENIDHKVAIQKGKSKWYKSYKLRVAKVDREYGFGEIQE